MWIVVESLRVLLLTIPLDLIDRHKFVEGGSDGASVISSSSARYK